MMLLLQWGVTWWSQPHTAWCLSFGPLLCCNTLATLQVFFLIYLLATGHTIDLFPFFPFFSCYTVQSSQINIKLKLIVGQSDCSNAMCCGGWLYDDWVWLHNCSNYIGRGWMLPLLIRDLINDLNLSWKIIHYNIRRRNSCMMHDIHA